MAPMTSYHLVTRQKQPQQLTIFQKLPEPCPPFGLNRSPPFQFMQRLKEFSPNLQDIVVIASTASVDIGLVTRSKTPLTNEVPAEKVTHVFTTTGMADDSRRAQMPMTEELTDTSPIGVTFDLSSRETVSRPLPKEEFDSSPGPLPALMILNNDGVLSSWWMVYADSIRQGTTFQGLTVTGGSQVQRQSQSERQVSPFAKASATATPAFGQSSFDKPSTPASPLRSTFSKPSTPAFGSTNAPVSAFGASSGLGKSQSPWGASSTIPAAPQTGPSAFGQPAFGSSTPMGGTSQGSAFGMAGGLGNRTSPWGAPQSVTAAASGSVFGQSGFSGANKPPFATSSSNTPFGASTAPSSISAPTSGGFASFATKPSGFMTAAPAGGAENVFGKSTPAASFGSGMDTDTSFGGTPKKGSETPKTLFGGEGFKLGSTFKGDGTSASDAKSSAADAPSSMFGDGFGAALGNTQKETIAPQTKDADMDEADDGAQAERAQEVPVEQKPNTPVAKPASPKFQFPKTVPPSTGGLFSTQAQSKNTPAAVQSSQPAGLAFGKPTPIHTTPKDTPTKPVPISRPSVETSSKIKSEPESDADSISPLNEVEAAPPDGYDTVDSLERPEAKTLDPPLPPESTSKTSYAPGDSSSSSKSSTDDAPLPPDFLPSKSKLKEVEAAPEEQAELPQDDEDDGLDDEGSGVDVAQEISPTTDPSQSPKMTPESSFGAPVDKTPPGGLFSKIPRQQETQKARPLFGEVGGTSAPFLPPPSKVQQSPRSPSPVRSMLSRGSLRPDSTRSISAPGTFKQLPNRSNAPTRTVVPTKPHQTVEERRKREQDRLAALQAQKAAEEEQGFSDQEDEKVREELATIVEGKETLDPFLAHQDYIGNIDKPGIPGQIEKVYRDINSMVDTLGLNARSLEAFKKGHDFPIEKGDRSREDLEKENWRLCEITHLTDIEEDLAEQLRNGRTQDVQAKISQCRDLRRQVAVLRAKGSDMGRSIDARSDPNEIESVRSAPLSLDQITQQQELRKKYTQFQKALAEVEAGIAMLRAKLASCNMGSGTGSPLKKPTVEAVTNTIMKMTSMVEKKSGDIDVLETQLRKLRLSSINSQSSREGSPATSVLSATPQRRKSPLRPMGKSLQNGHTRPPDLSASVLGQSQGSNGTPRKSVGEITPEEVQRYRTRVQRRQEVNAIIKESFTKAGPRIKGLD